MLEVDIILGYSQNQVKFCGLCIKDGYKKIHFLSCITDSFNSWNNSEDYKPRNCYVSVLSEVAKECPKDPGVFRNERSERHEDLWDLH